MAQKRKVKLLNEEFEREISSLVDEKIRESLEDIAQSDAEYIVNSVISKIDEIISNKVKEHFVVIAKFIIDKFSNQKE